MGTDPNFIHDCTTPSFAGNFAPTLFFVLRDLGAHFPRRRHHFDHEPQTLCFSLQKWLLSAPTPPFSENAFPFPIFAGPAILFASPIGAETLLDPWAAFRAAAGLPIIIFMRATVSLSFAGGILARKAFFCKPCLSEPALRGPTSS